MARPEDITDLFGGFNENFETLNEAQKPFDRYAPLEPGETLWFDKIYGRSEEGRRARSLLQAVALSPEYLFMAPLIETRSASARAVNIPWKDWGGDCYLNIKGIGSITSGETDEVREHLGWQINRRRPTGWRGISGREIISQVNQDAATFQHLVKHNPELAWDLNAPVWRPIAVVAGKGLIASLVDPYYDQGKYGIDQAVVSIRRLPYTKHRLDEYVQFNQPTRGSADGLRELDSLWNNENQSHTFLRAAERLGRAFSMLRKANVYQGQSFIIADYEGLGSAAWMNFNNIATDGSIGDLDCASKIDPDSGYVWWQKYEAFGSALMYLIFVNCIKPELLRDKTFLYKYFNSWRRGLGQEYTEKIRKSHNHGGTFEDVIDAIETLTGWYGSHADTRPDGSRTIGRSPYLAHHAKKIWVPSALDVIKTVKANRNLIGI